MQSRFTRLAAVSALLLSAPVLAFAEAPPYAGGHDDATYSADLVRGAASDSAAAERPQGLVVGTSGDDATYGEPARDREHARTRSDERLAAACTCPRHG
jgi:hypothetical protein